MGKNLFIYGMRKSKTDLNAKKGRRRESLDKQSMEKETPGTFYRNT